MTSGQTAGIVAALLVTAVAVFQVALALGLPLGDAVLGGTAATEDGVLTARSRVLAAAQAVLLVLMGWVLLARTEVLAIPVLGDTALVRTTWALAAFLALNTVANLAAPHPLERWGMGAVTATLTVVVLVIALRVPLPSSG